MREGEENGLADDSNAVISTALLRATWGTLEGDARAFIDCYSASSNENKRNAPILDRQSFMFMWRHEGTYGFFKGNGVNVVRIAPFSAFEFYFYELYKYKLFGGN